MISFEINLYKNVFYHIYEGTIYKKYNELNAV